MKTIFFPRAPKKITPAEATVLKNNYWDTCIDAGEQPGDILKSLSIDRAAVESIFQNKEVVKLRMYLGRTERAIPLKPDHTLILVGVDFRNENIVSTGEIWDNCSPCPSDCPLKDFQ